MAVRVARVLVHARAHEPAENFARSLGPSNLDKDDGRLKLLRLRALLACDDDEEIVRRFRRALDLTGRAANVRDLARILLNWRIEDVRARFAFDYFNPAKPGYAEAE